MGKQDTLAGMRSPFRPVTPSGTSTRNTCNTGNPFFKVTCSRELLTHCVSTASAWLSRSHSGYCVLPTASSAIIGTGKSIASAYPASMRE